MKKTTIVLLVAPLAAIGVVYAWSMLAADLLSPGSSGPTEPVILIGAPEKHTATLGMLYATNAMAKQDAPDFRAESNDGHAYSLKEVVKDGPVALVFIKDGCPCSIEAEPYFNRLHDAYGAKVRFFGVIDGDTNLARKWADKHASKFPLLADPDHKIVKEYHAENSAYFAIVAKGGVIQAYWPGYSASMLKDANEQIAELAGVEPGPIDTADAPAELYTGCPYFLD